MLREQQTPRGHLPPQLRASDASKETFLAELRRQNKELWAENQKLKQELKVAYGQVLGLEDLQTTNKDLEKTIKD